MTQEEKQSSARWFRRLLRLLPFDFRWEHGREMEQDFRVRRQRQDAEGGTGGMVRLWLDTLVDLLRTAPREHFDMLRQDVRFTLRSMRKHPGFTFIAVATLALGIGANTAIFGVVHAVAWGDLPFRDSDRLVRIYLVSPDNAAQISPRNQVFLGVREHNTVFESVAGQQYADFTVMAGGEPRRAAGMYVSEGWLGTLGIEPALGRGFSASEERLGLDSGVVLISNRLWDQAFGRDSGIVGREVSIDQRRFVVIGVMPSGFRYPYDNDLWLPVNFETGAPSSWGMNIQARLKPGVTLDQARAEMAALTPEIVRGSPEVSAAEVLAPFPTRALLLGDNGDLILVLLVAVGFMLAIACVNVGNLLLARSQFRRKEFAIRGALGAGRARQVRQLLTESVLLALGGGLAGTLLLLWTDTLLPLLIPGRMANLVEEVPISWAVLGFGLATTLVVGVAFGLLPAWTGSRPDLQLTLREGGRSGTGSGGSRMLSVLVVSEAALAVLLLTGAGLMGRNFQRLQQAELGYSVRDLVTFSVSLESERYTAPEARVQFQQAVLEEIRALPWVKDAGTTTTFPIDDGATLASLEVEGVAAEAGRGNLVHHRLVSPGFLEALGAPLLQGRRIEESDTEGSPPVAVISALVARRSFPGQDPIGKRLRNERRGQEIPWVTVVGVVGDVKEFFDVDGAWYVPYRQDAASRPASLLVFTVRGARPAGAGRELREAVWRVDPNLAVFNLEPMEQQQSDAIAEQRLGAMMSGAFALFGLLLAALGLYGVMAYAVGQRVHEIGVRMALGAHSREILALVLRHGTLLAVMGVGLGLAAAALMTRYLSSLLTEIDPFDPVSYGSAALFLVGVALVACWMPARRAARVDPMVALRTE